MQPKVCSAPKTPPSHPYSPKNKIQHMSLIKPNMEPQGRQSLMTVANGISEDEAERPGSGVKKLLADLFNMRSNMRELQENNQRMVQRIQRTYLKSREGRNDLTTPVEVRVPVLPIKDTSFNTTDEGYHAAKHTLHNDSQQQPRTDRSNLSRVGSTDTDLSCFLQSNPNFFKKQSLRGKQGLQKHKSTSILAPYTDNNSEVFEKLPQRKTQIAPQAIIPKLPLSTLMIMQGKMVGLQIEIYNKCTEKLMKMERLSDMLKNKAATIGKTLHFKDQKIRQQKSEISDLHAMLASYERRLSQCKSEISAKDSEITSMRKQFSDILSSFDQYKKLSEKNVQQLKLEIEELNNNQFQKTYMPPPQVQTLKIQVKDLEKQNNRLQQQLANYGSVTVRNVPLTTSIQFLNGRYSLKQPQGLQSQQTLLSIPKPSPSRASKQEMSFNLSAEGEIAQLLSLRPSCSIQFNIQAKVSDYVQRLRSTIREKNRLIIHLKHKLIDYTGEEKQQDTLSDFQQSLSERTKRPRKPPLWHKIQQQSLAFISKLMEQIEFLQSELETAQLNQKAFIQLKEAYKSQINHLRSIAERYQEYYEEELQTRSGTSSSTEHPYLLAKQTTSASRLRSKFYATNH